MHWLPAYIGLGANIGDPETQLLEAWRLIASLPGCRDARLSNRYASRPMGPQDQPDFVNAAGVILTTMAAGVLLDCLQRIESDLGRDHTAPKWGPRTIDLDLLVFGEHMIDEAGLKVPHPGVHERNFVLYPLADIAPDLWIPGKGPVSKLMVLAGDRGLERISQS